MPSVDWTRLVRASVYAHSQLSCTRTMCRQLGLILDVHGVDKYFTASLANFEEVNPKPLLVNMFECALEEKWRRTATGISRMDNSFGGPPLWLRFDATYARRGCDVVPISSTFAQKHFYAGTG